MRVNFVQLHFAEEQRSYRYKDILRHSNSSIEGPEALEDGYYGWKKEKDFAWFDNGDNDYVIAFYENHPFFNCMILRYADNLLYDAGGYASYSPASEVVEPWFKKVLTNYRRRQKRK